MISSAVFWPVYLGVLALGAVFVILYLLKAIAICDLSAEYKRPWWSFVPVLRGFAAGRAAAGGKSGFGIFTAVLFGIRTVAVVGVAGLYGAKLCNIIAEADRLLTDGKDVPNNIFNSVNDLKVFALAALAILLIVRIVSLICTYRTVKRVAPGMAAVCVVVSVFLPFAEPLFLFAVRHKGAEQ